MSKGLIYFTGIVLMAIAVNAIVSAQENALLLNDSDNIDSMNVSMNASSNTSSNETSNVTASVDIATNETAPVTNATLEDNATVFGAEDNAEVAGEASQVEMSPTVAGNNAVFSVGGDLASGNLFQINGNEEPQQPFDINMPTKPIKDVSKVFFACNII